MTRGLRICLSCAIAVVVEIGLYGSYRRHDASFHWFTLFFIGGAAALLVMTAVAVRSRRPVAAEILTGKQAVEGRRLHRCRPSGVGGRPLGGRHPSGAGPPGRDHERVHQVTQAG